jgi:hypothetical protein
MCYLLQVILTGEPLHKVVPAPPQPPPPATPAPGSAGTAAAAAAAGGDVLPFTVNDPGESHVLRPYWEYLCYLFRYGDMLRLKNVLLDRCRLVLH